MQHCVLSAAVDEKQVARCIVVLKPVQDIYTTVISVCFILLLAMTASTAVTILEQSGMVPSDATLISMQSNNTDTAATMIPVHEGIGLNGCGVIYHQVSSGDEYVAAAPEAGEDMMGTMHHAVYICIGTAAMTAGYI